jgi:hypothetical protein
MDDSAGCCSHAAITCVRNLLLAAEPSTVDPAPVKSGLAHAGGAMTIYRLLRGDATP